MMDVTVRRDGGKVLVRAPFNMEAKEEFKALGGRYQPSTTEWVFNETPEVARQLDSVLRRYFAYSLFEGQQRTVTVTVRIPEDARVSSYCNSIMFGGRVVARAQGRDSGGKPGDGVAFLEKKPTSGGSRNYWCTIIPGGSVFQIIRVPEEGWEEFFRDFCKRYEVEATAEVSMEDYTPDLNELMAERERLVKRLEEIDRTLESLRSSTASK